MNCFQRISNSLPQISRGSAALNSPIRSRLVKFSVIKLKTVLCLQDRTYRANGTSDRSTNYHSRKATPTRNTELVEARSGRHPYEMNLFEMLHQSGTPTSECSASPSPTSPTSPRVSPNSFKVAGRLELNESSVRKKTRPGSPSESIAA